MGKYEVRSQLCTLGAIGDVVDLDFDDNTTKVLLAAGHVTPARPASKRASKETTDDEDR